MSTLKRDLKIALLLGGPGAEREVSLVSGKSVYGALRQAGFTDVTEVDVHGPDFRLPEGTELAYNIIHGTFGEDGALQAILEERGVPYTGRRMACLERNSGLEKAASRFKTSNAA